MGSASSGVNYVSKFIPVLVQYQYLILVEARFRRTRIPRLSNSQSFEFSAFRIRGLLDLQEERTEGFNVGICKKSNWTFFGNSDFQFHFFIPIFLGDRIR